MLTRPSNVYTAEVFAGGRHWVTDNGSALFLGADWLGTTRALTNLGGTFDQLYTSLPWGDGLSSGGSSFHTTSQYTGKEYDPESGLYHFPARQYAPVQGRWLTPDPAGISAMSLDSPQSWNRYAYVLNNPLSNVDPTGLYPGGYCDTADPGCTGDGGVGGGNGDSADCAAEFSNCSGYYYEGLSIPGSTAAQLLLLGAFTVAGAGPGSSVSINGQLWTFIAWGGTSAGVLYGGAFLGGSSTDWGNWVGFGGTSIPGSMTTMTPGSGWIAANNGTPNCISRGVCKSPIDNLNLMEIGKTNYRDPLLICSTHTTVDNSTGATSSHVDLFNPGTTIPTGPITGNVPALPFHLLFDALPDAIYRVTGQYLLPAGRGLCQ